MKKWLLLLLLLMLILGCSKTPICGNGVIEKGETSRNCCEDTGCSDSDDSTSDICKKSTTTTSFCENTPIVIEQKGKADVDVVFIERTPRYERYAVVYEHDIPLKISNPGKKFPSEGDVVAFTAHISNKENGQTGTFNYIWKMNGIQVSKGTISNIKGGKAKNVSFNWKWSDDKEYDVEFIADTTDAVTETYESNNILKERVSANYLRFHVQEEVYNSFNSKVNVVGTKSFEDWAQAHVKEMNRLFEAGGSNERVRLDQVVIEPAQNEIGAPTNIEWDGSWRFGVWTENGEQIGWTPKEVDEWITKIQGPLIHELTHQLGIIDSYRLNYDWNCVPNNEVVPECKTCNASLHTCGIDSTIDHTYDDCVYYNPELKGIMGGQYELGYSKFVLGALNSNEGRRRGYYGEYLFDIPRKNYLRITSDSVSLVGAKVEIYQMKDCEMKLDSLIISDRTDNYGKILLPNRRVKQISQTETGHTLNANPFGNINVVGANGVFLIKIEYDGKVYYKYTDISRFNLEYWKGNVDAATIDIELFK